MDEMWTKEKGILGTVYTTIKGPVDIIRQAGKPISEKILKGDYLSAIKDTLANANTASVVAKTIEGLTNGTLSNFGKQGILTKKMVKNLSDLNGKMHKLYSTYKNFTKKKEKISPFKKRAMTIKSRNKIFNRIKRKINNSNLGQSINNSKLGKTIASINKKIIVLSSKLKKQVVESKSGKQMELLKFEIDKLKSLEGDRKSFEPTTPATK